ncbi:MAG: nucleotide pyrophosphohydrolase [Pseudomonadota bacterium]
MDLTDLRIANRMRQEEWPGNDQADTAFRTIEVAGESGEAVEEVLLTALAGLQMSKHTGRVAEKAKKLLRAERGIKGSTANPDDLADEMADCIIAIDLLANQTGIDLSAAVARKFNRTSEKYGLNTRLPTA